MPEPTLAQMRAWLAEEKVLSANGRRTAMLDAILAALGETSGEPVLLDALAAELYALPYFDAPGAETKVLRFDVYALLVKHFYAAAPRPTEEKPDA